MMERQPNIDEMVAFLDTLSPTTIAAVRQKNERYQNILKTGGILGTSADLQELKVRAQVCVAAIEVAISLCSKQLEKIKGRLQGARTLQVSGQIVTTVSGAGVLTSLATKHVNVSYLCGVLSLLGALVPIIVDYLKRTLDQTIPAFEQFSKLIDLKISVERNKREINFFLNENFNEDKIASIINETNGICETINKQGYFVA